jgi:hypothetical protein
VTDPRALLRAALAARAHTASGAFARAVGGDDHGSTPLCWGDLAEHFNAIFTTDEARLDAFEALRTARDLSALVLFLDLNRGRPGVLAGVWGVVSSLPATVQCALVALDLDVRASGEDAARLHPAARALLCDPVARAKEREFYAAQAGALRALRTRAPQVTEPASVARTP